MKQLKTAFLLATTIILISPAQGQFLDKLKRKLGNTVEDHAVEQVNKGVDKALQKLEDKMWQKMFGVKKSTMDSLAIAVENDPEAYEKMLEKYSSLGGEIPPIGSEYSFSSKATYKMSTNSEGKKTTMDYTMLLNSEKPYMGSQMGSMEMDGKKNDMPMKFTTIMDYETNTIIMIMEDQKMINAISMDKLNDFQESEYASNNTTINKTGKTKKILGYTSEEYLITSDNMEGNIWIAPDTDSFNKIMFRNLGNSAFADKPELIDMKGMMMEMDMTIKEENNKKPSTLTMQIQSLDKTDTSFDMSNYSAFSFGSMKGK